MIPECTYCNRESTKLVAGSYRVGNNIATAEFFVCDWHITNACVTLVVTEGLCRSNGTSTITIEEASDNA